MKKCTIHELEKEPLRLLADSDVFGKPPYLIDLEAFDGNGRCICPWFRKEYQPKLVRGERSDSTELMCKHLKRAHIYMARKMIRQIQARRRQMFPANVKRHEVTAWQEGE
jgi:hypothetical protein